MSEYQIDPWHPTSPLVPGGWAESHADANSTSSLSLTQDFRFEVPAPPVPPSPRGDVQPIVQGIQAHYASLPSLVVASSPPSHGVQEDGLSEVGLLLLISVAVAGLLVGVMGAGLLLLLRRRRREHPRR